MKGKSTSSIAYHVLHIITFSTLLHITTPSQVPDDIKLLIKSTQYKYCGSQFCTIDEGYKHPLCHEPSTRTVIDPFTNLTFIVREPERRQEHPLCNQCSCAENCVIFGDCCADKHIGGQYFFECQEIYQHISDSAIEITYTSVVRQCLPNAPNYKPKFAEKCAQGELGYIDDGRLVSAPHRYNTSVTFKNKYCAMCYGVTEYTPWDVYISCQSDLDFDNSNYTNLNSLIRNVKEKSSCDISISHKDASVSLLCLKYQEIISTCNVTGSWQEYNASIEIACHSYLNPVLSYRNLFCALCNGESMEDLLCHNGYSVTDPNLIKLMHFSAILNFDTSDVEVVQSLNQNYPITRIGKQEQHHCRHGDVYDAVSRKCRELYCPLSFEYSNITCVQLVPSENLIITIWKLTTYYTDDILVPYGSFFSSFGNTVIEKLKDFLYESGFIISKGSQKDYANIHSTSEIIVKESQLKLLVLLQANQTLVLARQQLEAFENYTMNITWKGQSINVLVVPDPNPRNLTKMLLLSTIDFGSKYLQIDNFETNNKIEVSLAFNITCSMLRFEPSEVLIVNNSIIIHEDKVLKEQEYIIYDNNYYICTDTILQKKEKPVLMLSETSVSDINSKIEQLITIICFTCSLIFLVITILVYSFISQLHTVPGLNLIFLCSSLFVAQALYLFGAGAVTTPTICIVIGVVIHYLWLVSFAWMNVCCFHMFRVFANLFNSLDFADYKKYVMLKYSAFAFGLPLVIVGITISTSYIISDNTSIAYGGPTLCFVSSGLVSVLSFGIPAGVTVITNTFLLMYTIVSLRRAKNIHTSKNKPGTSDIIKFFKLSTITGVSWLFGFLGYFLQRVELLYVFTVFTAGQGVFIFFSFAASRRILKMIRERFVCRQSKRDGNYRYNETYSTAQTFSELVSTSNNESRM